MESGGTQLEIGREFVPHGVINTDSYQTSVWVGHGSVITQKGTQHFSPIFTLSDVSFSNFVYRFFMTFLRGHLLLIE